MEHLFPFLSQLALFQQINKDELPHLLKCLKAHVKHYPKKTLILNQGEQITSLGIVITGGLQIFKDDPFGERTVITTIEPGHFFGEAIYFSKLTESPVSVLTILESTILFLDFHHLTLQCHRNCSMHHQLINNMLYILATKNVMLQKRLSFLDKRTMQDKIIAFLLDFKTPDSDIIKIPYNREEMAHFLCVDRTSLSHQLAKMKKEGIIDYHKNTFRLQSSHSINTNI